MKWPNKKVLSAAVAAAAGATVIAVGTVTGLPGAANAAPSPNGAHCALNPNSGEQACFDTFDEAMAFASGGAIEDAPANGAQAMRDQGFQAKVAAADEQPNNIIQGTVFSDTNFGGSSLTIYGPEMCKKDGWVNWQLDLSEDWKNTISSVGAWGECWIWLYPEPGLNGDRDGPFKQDTADIGEFMNDRAQSIGFS
jgi:hypothetical protein